MNDRVEQVRVDPANVAGSGVSRAPHGAQQSEGEERELRPEDQARVDGFLRRGVNSVDRKPFRPMLLMIMLVVVVAGLSLLSQLIARVAGVY
jgi:hypothetical protein